MKRSSLGGRAPRGQLQRQTGEVDLGDLGLEVGPPRGVLELAPQPVGDAGLGASGATGALVGRGPAGGTVVSRVIPVPLSKRGTRARPASTTMRTPRTVSDDSAMSVHSTTRRRPGGDGGERRVLLGERQRAGQRVHVDVGGRRVGERAAATRRISPMPGRNTSTSPGSSRSARADGRRPSPARCARAWPAAPSGRRRGAAGRRSRRRRTSRDRRRARRSSRATSGVADIASMRRSGRRSAARVERERQAEVGRQVALVDLVEDHEPDAGRAPGRAAGGGSARPR